MTIATPLPIYRERMSRVDAAWLHMEVPGNPMMITGVLTFDKQLDWDKLREVFQTRLIDRYPRFSMRPDNPNKQIDNTYWVTDENFELSSHFGTVRLDGDGSKTQLETLIGTLMSSPLDLTKPLWHFQFVENYLGGCAVIGRLHHCIGDGIALLRTLISLTDPEKLGDSTEVGLLDKTSQNRHGLDDLGEEIRPKKSLFQLLKFYSGIAVGSVAAFAKLTLSWPDKQTLLREPIGLTKQAAWSRTIPLTQVRALAHELEVTINDVLTSAVAGALGTYLTERGDNVKRVRMVVPVNLRPLDGPIELGNKFGLVFLPLPIGTVDDESRLRKLKASMDRIKRSPEAFVAYNLLAMVGRIPPWVERIVMQIFGSKVSGVMTNVPGPRKPIFLAGHELKTLMFWVPQSGGLGLGISIISYNNQVWVGVTGDDQIIDDPHELVRGFELEFDQIISRSRVVSAEPMLAVQPA